MYPNEDVARFITERFLPIRVHVRDQKDDYKKLAREYGVQWTPSLLVLDPEGEEQHRIEGFLPAEDLIAELNLGLAHSAFKRERFDEAEHLYREVIQRAPDSEAAPAAVYWAGVSRYKASHDASALGETARELEKRYGTSAWARKASVWKHEEKAPRQAA